MISVVRIPGSPHRWNAALICLAATLVVGCAPSKTDPSTAVTSSAVDSESRPVVIVVNYPLHYFANRIGGDWVQVSLPVPDDQDPAYWEPSGDQIAEIQTADLVLLNGADYAKWTLRATLPWSRTVVTCEGLEDRLIEIPDAVVHSHGPEGEHSHAGIVSETWLDPDLAIQQARAVCDALCDVVPDHKTALEARFGDLEQDLNKLAAELDETLQQASAQWLSAKPRFHYLLSRADDTIEVLHWEATEAIESSQWDSLTSNLAGKPAIMLWSTSPPNALRDRLAKEGVQSIVLDTVASRPNEGDFLSVMRDNVAVIRSALQSHAGSGKQKS